MLQDPVEGISALERLFHAVLMGDPFDLLVDQEIRIIVSGD